jgi:Ser/Thr protein kinase RdoA (MazF antagonist)
VSEAIADVLRPGWSVQPLDHNPLNAATGGIWRVRRDDGTAILKILWPGGVVGGRSDWATSDDPGHWNYWRREGLAYRTGLCATAYAAGGIRAPDLLEAVDRADGSVALWLEDVDGTPGTACTPTQLGDVAGRLGTAHAAWLGRADDGPAWLSRDWLRDYSLSRPVTEPVDWDHPLAAEVWPRRLREDLRTLWERRHAVLAATDQLPRTLCHHDVWPMNLFVDADGPVLFDWTFVGPGAIGEDPANLILDTFLDGLVRVEHLTEVADIVCAAYAEGLAGSVDAATVHRAIRLAAAAKYFWLAPRMLNHLAVPNPHQALGYDARDDLEMFAGRRAVLDLLATWFRTDHGS